MFEPRALLRAICAICATVAVALALAACTSGSGSRSTPPTTSAAATVTTAGVPQLSVTSFASDFSAMSQLQPLASRGKGLIGVLLPGAGPSSRSTAFDTPYLIKALTSAGLTANDFEIDNAQGDATQMQAQAAADIARGARVLVVDALDTGSGAAIESDAAAHGVTVIDYDRFVPGGKRSYFVGFGSDEVGKTMGQGMVDCVAAWNVAAPQLLLLDGSPSDPSAAPLAQGYKSVLRAPAFTLVAEPGGTWDAQLAHTIVDDQLASHPAINAVVAASDALADAVISVLRTRGAAARTVPVVGNGATVRAMQNVLAGYQCGSVYSPLYAEAQAAAALAVYVRAGQAPPPGLIAAQTADAGGGQVPSVLLHPTWVTAANMESTVVKDTFDRAVDICTAAYQAACLAAGIS